jgi:hypothetical protein
MASKSPMFNGIPVLVFISPDFNFREIKIAPYYLKYAEAIASLFSL